MLTLEDPLGVPPVASPGSTWSRARPRRSGTRGRPGAGTAASPCARPQPATPSGPATTVSTLYSSSKRTWKLNILFDVENLWKKKESWTYHKRVGRTLPSEEPQRQQSAPNSSTQMNITHMAVPEFFLRILIFELFVIFICF